MVAAAEVACWHAQHLSMAESPPGTQSACGMRPEVCVCVCLCVCACVRVCVYVCVRAPVPEFSL